QVVVGELRVVREVLQVVEDSLARSVDEDRDGHGIHGAQKSISADSGPRRPANDGPRSGYAARAVRRTVCPRSAWRTLSRATGGSRRSGRHSSQTMLPWWP